MFRPEHFYKNVDKKGSPTNLPNGKVEKIVTEGLSSF